MIYCTAEQASGCFTDRKLHNSRACVASSWRQASWQQLKTRVPSGTLLLAPQVPQIHSDIPYPVCHCLKEWSSTEDPLQWLPWIPPASSAWHPLSPADTVLSNSCRVTERLLLGGTWKAKVVTLQLRNSLPRPADKLRWENTSRNGQVQPPSVHLCLTRAESLSWICWWQFS